MSVIQSKDIADKSIKDLRKLLIEQQKSLHDLRMKNAFRWLKETHLISVAKKNIARISTFLTSKYGK